MPAQSGRRGDAILRRRSMILLRMTSRLVGPVAMVLALMVAATTTAAPSGPPIRIGGTLALTGPLAATALLHKITGEIYVEELNRGNGLLGRPVEWVLLDDQSKPEVTRTLYEKLITVDKVDLLMGPYEFGARDFGPIAARIKDANPDLLWVGALGLDGNLVLEELKRLDYSPRRHFHLFPAPGPMVMAPEAKNALSSTFFEEHPPFTNNPVAARFAAV